MDELVNDRWEQDLAGWGQSPAPPQSWPAPRSGFPNCSRKFMQRAQNARQELKQTQPQAINGVSKMWSMHVNERAVTDLVTGAPLPPAPMRSWRRRWVVVFLQGGAQRGQGALLGEAVSSLSPSLLSPSSPGPRRRRGMVRGSPPGRGRHCWPSPEVGEVTLAQQGWVPRPIHWPPEEGVLGNLPENTEAPVLAGGPNGACVHV